MKSIFDHCRSCTSSDIWAKVPILCITFMLLLFVGLVAVGVTGSSASNLLAEQADVVLAVGSRLQDFTTGSWTLFKNEGARIVGLNVQPERLHQSNCRHVRRAGVPPVRDCQTGHLGISPV